MKINYNEAIWAVCISLVLIFFVGPCTELVDNNDTQLRIACLAKGNPPLHCKELR